MKIRSLLALLACAVAGALWLRAEEAAPSDTENTDKWTQIQNNQKAMLKKVDDIQQNLTFIKARSMSGGRRS